MKRFSFVMGLVAATMFAAPLAAQSRNAGPWWDPSNTRSRVDNRNGTVYDRNGNVVDRNGNVIDRNGNVTDRNGNVYDRNGNLIHRADTRVDGQWHLAGRDSNGNNVYVRTRYDSNGNIVQEAAHRNILGRYSVFESRVVSNASNTGVYGRNDRDRNNDGWEDGRVRNDRWDQNNGHDNGRHNGQYKNKNKNRNNNRHN